MEDPGRHLVPPVAPQEQAADGYVNITQFLDYASPTAWLNEAIEAMTGFDVLETVVKPFAGDWERFGAYGDALHHISECLGEMAVQVQAHTSLLGSQWTGNAADGAYFYFSNMATSLSRHAKEVERAHAKYTELALDMWHIAEQVKGILQAVCDLGLVALAEIAAGTALAETGVGAVVGYALAALTIAKIVERISEAAIVVQTANAIIDLFFAGVAEIVKDLGDLGSIPTPRVPYQNPMVVTAA